MSGHGPDFFETRMGVTFYQGTMPRIAKALEALVERLDELDITLSDGRTVEVQRFDPQDPAEQDSEELLHQAALRHARRGLADPRYAKESLAAIVYYLEQIENR